MALRVTSSSIMKRVRAMGLLQMGRGQAMGVGDVERKTVFLPMDQFPAMNAIIAYCTHALITIQRKEGAIRCASDCLLPRIHPGEIPL